MQEMETWAGRSKFQYKGAIPYDIRIYFGKGQRQTITAQQWSALCAHFSGKIVKVGTSRDNPPKGSLGEWLQQHVTKTAIASYVAPILVQSGLAERVPSDKTLIRFL